METIHISPLLPVANFVHQFLPFQFQVDPLSVTVVILIVVFLMSRPIRRR